MGHVGVAEKLHRVTEIDSSEYRGRTQTSVSPPVMATELTPSACRIRCKPPSIHGEYVILSKVRAGGMNRASSGTGRDLGHGKRYAGHSGHVLRRVLGKHCLHVDTEMNPVASHRFRRMTWARRRWRRPAARTWLRRAPSPVLRCLLRRLATVLPRVARRVAVIRECRKLDH